MQERFDEVREEVKSADFSAKDEVFHLAQLALLEDEAAFFELLPNILEANKITKEDLQNWPLFRQMRETKTYKERYIHDQDDKVTNSNSGAT